MIGFPLASETPQLQAADLLAYLSVEHLKNHLNEAVHAGPELAALLKNTRMAEDHQSVNKEVFRSCLSTILPIAPVLAYEHEDEEELPE
jgi:hypothetical protein